VWVDECVCVCARHTHTHTHTHPHTHTNKHTRNALKKDVVTYISKKNVMFIKLFIL